jgi:hypothetical protein
MTLLDQVIHRGLDTLDSGDGIEAKTKHTVRDVGSKSGRFLLGQTNGLVLDLVTANVDGVGTENTVGVAAITVMDLP